MTTAFSQNIDRAFESGGISRATFDGALKRLAPALDGLREAHARKSLALLGLPERTEDFAAMEAMALRLRGADDVVFLGTGGSSLGGQTIAQLAGYAVPGVGALQKKPRVHFLDNLDPASLGEFLELLPLAGARFVAISKSGGTAETLMQTMAVIVALKQKNLKVAEHLFGISEPAKPGKNNALRALLDGCELIEHDTGVGGRFSGLTNVGLLPALVLGLDARALRAGAAESLQPVLDGANLDAVNAALGAALNFVASEAGKPIAVTMAYGDRLKRFTRWWMQLWGESLGKDGKGTTPVAAVGPVDQHSQLQLWLAGPKDKLFTIVTTGMAGTGPRMDAALAKISGEAALGGKTVGDLVAAQGRATADTLAKNHRPVRTIHIGALNEFSLGALMMHFMLETILAASLFGIEPYEQPAVEEGKVLAKRYLADAK